jgi:hypothetical protein
MIKVFESINKEESALDIVNRFHYENQQLAKELTEALLTIKRQDKEIQNLKMRLMYLNEADHRES